MKQRFRTGRSEPDEGHFAGGMQFSRPVWQQAPTGSHQTSQATKVRTLFPLFRNQLTPFDRPIRRRTRTPSTTTRICNAGYPNGPTPTDGHVRLPSLNTHARAIRCRRAPATSSSGRDDARNARDDDTPRVPAAAGVRDASPDDGNAHDGRNSAAASWIHDRLECVPDAAEMMREQLDASSGKEKHRLFDCGYCTLVTYCCRVKAHLFKHDQPIRFVCIAYSVAFARRDSHGLHVLTIYAITPVFAFISILSTVTAL